MKNVVPHIKLIKPRAPRTESDCEREALKFLRSWTRACKRLARGNGAETIKVPQPQPKRSHAADGACDCAVPVRCFTNVDGGVLEQCLRCGESNVVERQPGIPTIRKERAAELTIFGPGADR